jgi:hypothetical protein
LGTFWLLLFYPIYGFQHIPQEWGGPSPRAVQFDLATEHLSPASKKLLLPDGTPPEAAQVQRSRVLYLIFDGGEFVLVARQSAPVGGKDNPVLRIRKATIEGVFPAQEGGQ